MVLIFSVLTQITCEGFLISFNFSFDPNWIILIVLMFSNHLNMVNMVIEKIPFITLCTLLKTKQVFVDLEILGEEMLYFSII